MAQAQVVANGTFVAATFEWNGAAVAEEIDRATGEAMHDLAADILPYLVSTLHRWSGAMAEASYVEVGLYDEGWVIHAGSDVAHAIWHELRYHPQLRQTMDRFAPLIGPTIQAHL